MVKKLRLPKQDKKINT